MAGKRWQNADGEKRTLITFGKNVGFGQGIEQFIQKLRQVNDLNINVYSKYTMSDFKKNYSE